jgi:hypothetical protein
VGEDRKILALGHFERADALVYRKGFSPDLSDYMTISAELDL